MSVKIPRKTKAEKPNTKERYQTRFIDYLKSSNCRDEFRHYVMYHEQALQQAIVHGYKIPASVKADYVIDMKGYQIKTLKLTTSAHREAYAYYMSAQDTFEKYDMSKLKHPFKLTGRKTKPNLKVKGSAITKKIENQKSKKTVYKGFLVTGNTYTIKNQLKSMGGKWVKDEEGWVIPTSAAKQLKAFAKGKKLTITALKTEENVFRRLSAAERLDIRKEKAEKKINRWESQAGNASKRADEYDTRAHNLVKDYPLGQPYHTDRPSGRSMLNKVHRSQDLTFKAVDEYKKANELSSKAQSLERINGYINSPTSIKGRIAKLESELKSNAKKAILTNDTKKRAYYGEIVKNLKIDIESLKALLPTEAMEISTGLTMADLTKLKKPLGLAQAVKRYHNKNLSGGNFAVELRWSKEIGQGMEISGYHDPDGVVTRLEVGRLYQPGVTIVNKSNYKEMTLEKLIPILKKAMETLRVLSP
jgi:hypothetical protein